MTGEERIESLKDFGYNRREAAFLSLAALHSGFFVRRQYNQFADCKHGTTVMQLVRRTAANRHTRLTVFPYNTGVYHLCSRPFYEALGDGDNRNRRRRSALAIKPRLMALDFVLLHPRLTFLATEPEKLDYFGNHRKILPYVLPRKIYSSRRFHSQTSRYFVDKFPLSLSSTDSGSSAVVGFSYVDPGTRSLGGFYTFLKQYSRLFRWLRRLRLTYVANTERHFEAAERKFKAFTEFLDSKESIQADTQSVLDYFRLEHLYQREEFHSLTKARLIRLKKGRRRFSDPETQGLFQLWKHGGDSAVRGKLQPEKAGRSPFKAEFRTCLLEHNYDYLETFTRR